MSHAMSEIDRYLFAYVLIGESVVRIDQIAAVINGVESGPTSKPSEVVLINGARIEVAMSAAAIFKLLNKTMDVFRLARERIGGDDA